MRDNTQQKILNAFLIVLRPMAKILLKYGIGFRDFSEIAKTAFVDVASTDFGIRGRPTNISRVAVMTGLTRKEVRRIRETLSEGHGPIEVKSTPLGEILHRWHSESAYVDNSGRPIALEFAGDESSFSGLVKLFGGDIPPGAMRTELKRVGAVEEDENGKLRVIRRVIYPGDDYDNLITAVVHGVYPMVATISHNLTRDKDTDANPWPQFNAYSRRIRKSDMPRLQRISRDRMKEIAESFDDLFMAYEAMNNDDPESDQNVVSIGVYYFEERDDVASKVW